VLANAVGTDGLVRGQFDDLRNCPATCSAETARLTNQRKTAALFLACVESACIVAGVRDARRKSLRSFAVELGHAFQLLDDLLDLRAEAGCVGKNTGQDGQRATVLTLAGEARTVSLLQAHLSAALHHAALRGGPGLLRQHVAALFAQRASLCLAA
jgi:geranylgeranyl diphosphate synthase type II